MRCCACRASRGCGQTQQEGGHAGVPLALRGGVARSSPDRCRDPATISASCAGRAVLTARRRTGGERDTSPARRPSAARRPARRRSWREHVVGTRRRAVDGRPSAAPSPAREDVAQRVEASVISAGWRRARGSSRSPRPSPGGSPRAARPRSARPGRRRCAPAGSVWPQAGGAASQTATAVATATRVSRRSRRDLRQRLELRRGRRGAARRGPGRARQRRLRRGPAVAVDDRSRSGS